MTDPDDPPPPEQLFLDDMRRHRWFGIAFACGCVVLVGYAVVRMLSWSP